MSGIPSGLVPVAAYGKPKVLLVSDAAEALTRVQQAMRSAGIAYPLGLPVSGWRSMAEQSALFEASDKTGVWVAKPGYSVHQTGRAIDIWLGLNLPDKGMTQAKRAQRLQEMRDSPIHKWLVQNALSFGFYPYEVEPWHWEYGKPHDPKGADIPREVSDLETGKRDEVQRAIELTQFSVARYGLNYPLWLARIAPLLEDAKTLAKAPPSESRDIAARVIIAEAENRRGAPVTEQAGELGKSAAEAVANATKDAGGKVAMSLWDAIPTEAKWLGGLALGGVVVLAVTK